MRSFLCTPLFASTSFAISFRLRSVRQPVSPSALQPVSPRQGRADDCRPRRAGAQRLQQPVREGRGQRSHRDEASPELAPRLVFGVFIYLFIFLGGVGVPFVFHEPGKKEIYIYTYYISYIYIFLLGFPFSSLGRRTSPATS